MKRMTAVVAVLLAGSFALVACGSDDSTSSDGGSTSAQFNEADVQFVQGMIPHHQQAVVMAQMAATHASDPEVKNLAAEIEAAQSPEIATMTQWLQDWDKEVPSASDSSMPGMEMGDGSHMDPGDMPGMMSDADLAQLDEATGADWDQMFLTMMIEHHQGAIDAAKTEQADGQNPDAVALAKKIEAAQTAEIATMESMLQS